MATCTLLRMTELSHCEVPTDNLPSQTLSIYKPNYAETLKDIRDLINKYLSIDDFIALMRVDRAHRQAVLSVIFTRLFWKDLQCRLGFHLDNSSSLDDQTLNQLFDMAYRITMIPLIINRILENRSEILRKNDKGYLYPIALLKATGTFLKWYQAPQTKTSIHLKKILFENGYTIFGIDARCLNSFLRRDVEAVDYLSQMDYDCCKRRF